MGQPGLGGRRVAVYVSGSIAAYKACEVVTGLRKQGCEVRVAMTAAAQHFVGPTTLRSLSGHAVATSVWEAADDAMAPGHGMGHISLGEWAELQVAVPASADLIARLALGLADDAPTASALASTAPLLLAPAMETRMWESAVTQANVALLRARGGIVVGPATGRLASGHAGVGRMVEAPEVVDAVARVLAGPAPAGDLWLTGRRVVVTSGGTREPIDPVRFIGNRSSGRMGAALAAAAEGLGAEVTLVTTLADPGVRAARVVRVETAAEMRAAVVEHLGGAAILVMAAAVADYRPRTVSPRKLKKAQPELSLDLVRTVDILDSLRDEPARRGVVVVGFAAETDDLEANAAVKLETKRLDAVVANDVSAPGIGMGSEDNAVLLLARGGRRAEVPRAPKAEVARRVLEEIRPLVVG